MPREIDLPGLRVLLGRGDVQPIDVLPQKEYEEEYLPGAINATIDARGVCGCHPECW